MKTKPFYQSKTIVGAVIGLGLGLLNLAGVEISQEEWAVVVEAVVALASFGLVVWGRITARKEIHFNTGTSASVWLAAMVLAALCLLGFTGCSQLSSVAEKVPQELRPVAREAAKATLNYALRELAGRVNEVEPYVPILQGAIEVTFANAREPEDVGAELRKAVTATIVDPGLRELVLADWQGALMQPEGTTASAGGDDFGVRLAAELVREK